ncbi:AAA family ATPase [Thalassospira sp. HF15]|uniref:AAA family ATPase n=1 Tax=Thalassospira sp. HF15 TaxID=2722755 RepID=UPI001431A2C3|nr:AAA family ATPase [Thalassospira sp. HF15]NIY77829.1 AAA family ATPase [Thalassospira sp. HF15]
MRVKRFRGTSVNGYLNFDVGFFDDLTFVTGINGSGKTTALNCIFSLLMPRLDYLNDQEFEEISVDIATHQNENVTLTVNKNENYTEITCSKFPSEKLQIPLTFHDDSFASFKFREDENEIYQELIDKNRENSVLEFILSLPTPMYLGLDRRVVSLDENNTHQTWGRRLGKIAKRRNVFGRSLGESLEEALDFAQDSYRKTMKEKSKLDAYFKEELVITLLDFPPVIFDGKISPPTKAEIKELEDAKRHIKDLPHLLKISDDAIFKNIEPLFSHLDKTIALIEKQKKARAKKTDKDRFTEVEAIFSWNYNKTHFWKLTKLSEQISDYNKKSDEIFEKTNRFLRAVNSFMKDSGKKIQFNEVGELLFSQESKNKRWQLKSLSSGEIQLIVILTHLHFNPEVENANIFIIDEPELSLHVQWQEKFIDEIITASTNIQFILATHSPSVILDRTNKCKDISLIS